MKVKSSIKKILDNVPSKYIGGIGNVNKRYPDTIISKELAEEIAKIINVPDNEPYKHYKDIGIISYNLNGLFIMLFNINNFIALNNLDGIIIKDSNKLREMTKQAFETGYFQINGFDNETIDFIGRAIYGEAYDKTEKMSK